MNKILSLVLLSTTLALASASAEAARPLPAPTYGQSLVEGRNAAESFVARNAAAAIREQAEGNLRSAN